jgi:hypothetical protein
MVSTASLQQLSQQDERLPYRVSIMDQIACGELDVPESTRQFETIRWLNRVSHHLERMMWRLHIVQTKHNGKADKHSLQESI